MLESSVGGWMGARPSSVKLVVSPFAATAGSSPMPWGSPTVPGVRRASGASWPWPPISSPRLSSTTFGPGPVSRRRGATPAHWREPPSEWLPCLVSARSQGSPGHRPSKRSPRKMLLSLRTSGVPSRTRTGSDFHPTDTGTRAISLAVTSSSSFALVCAPCSPTRSWSCARPTRAHPRTSPLGAISRGTRSSGPSIRDTGSGASETEGPRKLTLGPAHVDPKGLRRSEIGRAESSPEFA